MSEFHKKLLIHSAVFLALLLVIGVSLFFVGAKIKAYATEIETTRDQLYNWIVSLQSFAAIRSEYATKAESYSRILENRLPEKELLIDLKKELQFIAAGDAVSVNLVFNSEVETAATRVGAISFTMTVKGPLENVTAFISHLNNIRYLISLDSMTMSKGADGVMDVDVRGKVLFRK